MSTTSLSHYDFLYALLPVLVVTVLFSILIAARIYATSLPVNKNLQFVDPDGLGLDGMS
jgi:hypothetical protein